MKNLLCIFLLLLPILSEVKSQKIPIGKKGGHLISIWTLNKDIKARVFLETGFPKIVFSESFVKNNSKTLGIELKTPEKDLHVGLWGTKDKYKVTYIIKDSIIVNGIQMEIDAVVIDTKNIKSWKERDIVFPLRDLNRRVEINIDKNYMQIMDDSETIPDEYIAYTANSDPATKALYFNTTLKVFDKNGKAEELSGNFQLDLGAANAIYVNKNLKQSADFVARCSRMTMKDMSNVSGPKEMNLSIITPNKLQIGNIELKGYYIVAMKYAQSKNSDKYSGNVGNAFFSNFSVIFDFNNEKIYFKPISKKVKFTD